MADRTVAEHLARVLAAAHPLPAQRVPLAAAVGVVAAAALASLAHLGHGLALILAFIGVKLVLHWAHGVWAWVPEVPTPVSLAVVVGILATVTVTSLVTARRSRYAAARDGAHSA